MFKRNSTSRYSRASKRPAYRKGKYPMSKGRVASRYTLINTVEQVMRRNAELKYHDASNSHTFPVGGSFVRNDVSAVAQGTTDTTRTGDRLKLRSLEFRIQLQDLRTTLSVDGMNVVRVVFVQWFPSGTPNSSDIFSAVANTCLGFYAHDTRQMYKILWDKTYALTGATSRNFHLAHGTIYFKKNNMIQYSGGGTTGTNKIYMFALYTNGGAGVTTNLYADTRLRYYDS